MPKAISAERWAAARALMRLEAPTQVRVAAAMGIHLTTLAQRMAREQWPVLDFRRVDIQAAHEQLRERLVRRFVLGMEAAEQAVAQAEKAEELACDPMRILMQDPEEESEDVAALTPDEIRERLSDLLPKQLVKVISLAERGVVDKARLESLLIMLRVAERADALAAGQQKINEKKSDEELAKLHARLDARIVELAEGYAERLLAGERPGPAD